LFSDRFSVPEMKRIYRGFKTECPTGLITEEAFHSIYARFFPNGGIRPCTM
jgi:Ca2+-binding EF-hand superfamily protein